MSIAALIRRMAEAGATPEAIAIAVEAIEQASSIDEERRARARDKKARQRAVSRDMVGTVPGQNGDTPLSPSLDKEKSPTPPKETNPSPLTPHAGLTNGREANDLDGLTAKLCEAAGDKIQPHGALVVGPILELIAQGVDLETDVLPAIRSAASRMKRPASRWTYFVGAIKDAHSQRIEAGKGVAQPKVTAIKRDEDMTPEELRSAWQKRLDFARPRQQWPSWLWGPMPGQPGCRVPADMLRPTDGKFFDGAPWLETKQEAA